MLPALESERQLLAIEAASVPHMTDQGRRDVVAHYQRRTRPSHTETRARSAHEALTAAGIAVVHVPKTAGHAGTRRKGKR